MGVCFIIEITTKKCNHLIVKAEERTNYKIYFEILMQNLILHFLTNLISIHSKSEKVCGVCFSVTKKSAEKVRKSRHKFFATKVRKLIESLKMHHLKAKCKKI